MNKKELKSLIKEMVRESLTEIFVEMKLESIVENVVKQQTPRNSAPAYEVSEPVQPRRMATRPVEQKKVLRENIKKNLGVSDDEWRDIYQDVNMDKLPPSGDTASENPEFVSVDDMRALGFDI